MGTLRRVQQGLANLTARMAPADWALVAQHLSGAEWDIFAQMEAADQRHSVQVLRSLLAAGITDASLLKAGLLHDVGKSRCRISIFHRTAAVLVQAILGRLPDLPLQCGTGKWWLPFHVIANHPRIGASMLAHAGTDERVWRLVELHQLEPSQLGQTPERKWLREALTTLQKADNEN